MRIRNIYVSGLFGIFDHRIPLDPDNRITLIHSPNGYGKTTILRLVNAVFFQRRALLRNIPFDELSISLQNDAVLSIRKAIKDKEISLEYHLKVAGERKRHFVDRHLSPREIPRIPFSMIEHEIPELERIGPQTWRNFRTHEMFDLDDILFRYGDDLPIPLRYRREISKPDWLNEFLNSVSIRLIEAQRLLRIPEDVSYSERHRHQRWSVTVEAYAEDLAGAIKSKLAESAALSQSLDRTFPQRLVDTKRDDLLSEKELLTRMNSIENHRSKLIDATLLDPQREPAFQIKGELSEHNRRVLSVWVKDIEKKLSIYDELAAKIDLFKEIINKHFLFKEIEIDKEAGFVFRTPEGISIAPTLLSSGEQHELVLAYELLFKVNKDSLVLIDEPELSLHVAWQLRFLKDLQSIVQLSPFDALIATHSPQIINERWDLTVKLKGPHEDD